VDKAYFVDAALLLPSIVAVLMIKSSGQPKGARRKINLRSLIEGFEFLWQQRIILSLFLLDFFAVLVGFYRPILPIFASDVFRVGAGGLGALYAAPAIGALVGSGLVLLAGNIERKGAAAVIGTFLFALSLGLLGLSQWFWMGLLAAGALGFSDATGVAIRRTVVQILAPDNMRGRASSFLTIFAQGTNALGAIIAGAAAALVGASNALLIGSVLCAVTIFGVCWGSRNCGLIVQKSSLKSEFWAEEEVGKNVSRAKAQRAPRFGELSKGLSLRAWCPFDKLRTCFDAITFLSSRLAA
jgi:MFS family permease